VAEEKSGASKGKWELQIPPGAMLERVEWDKRLQLPPLPTLEWEAEQYFSSPSTELEVGEPPLTVQWFSRQLAREKRVRKEQVPFLVSCSIDGLRNGIKELVGRGGPIDTPAIHRFLGTTGRPVTRILMGRHPDLDLSRRRAIQGGNVFRMLSSQLRPFTGIRGLPGESTQNITGWAEYDDLYLIKEMEGWKDRGVPLSVTVTMDWVSAFCRSRNRLWVPPTTMKWYVGLLIAFNGWLEESDVH